MKFLWCIKAATLLLFVGCSKPDNTPPATPADLTGRISKITQTYSNDPNNNIDTYVFTYNGDGTVAQIDRGNDAGGPFSTIYFTQQTDYSTRKEVILSSGYTTAQDSFRYDAQGRLYEDYEYTGTEFRLNRRYFYRADGPLDHTEEPTGFGSDATVKYTWGNGDNIKIDYGFVTVAYSYFTNEVARPGDAQMISDLLLRGRVMLPNAHLVKGSSFLDEPPTAYSYTFAGGRVATVTRDNEGSYGTVVQTLSYEN